MKDYDIANCPQRKRLVSSRVRLLINKPWFGNMVTRMKLVDATDAGWCHTAATDARHLFYNRDFVARLRDGEVDFLFGHELLHCVFDHIGRRKDRDAKVWNIANDFVVNNILVEEQVGELITTIKICHDYKYRDMSSEEVYEDLMANATKIDMSQLLDQHLDLDGGESTDDDAGAGANQKSKDSKDSKEDEQGPPAYTEEEKKKLKDEFKNAMIQAAQAAGAGNVPKSVKRLIKELTSPTIDWRELLNMQIQSIVREDYTFMKQSRRSWHSDAILPGMNTAETIDVVVALDASGSISNEMLRDMLSEVKGCMSQYDDFTVTVFSFDTEVYNCEKFDPWNIDDIDTYEIKGGGGTDFEICFNYMKENEIEPKKFIMFTDGYPWNSWGDPDYCDTIFVIHSYHNKEFEAPFGLTAHYEPHSEGIRKAA
jgi:predicted metal-dependent peptidase